MGSLIRSVVSLIHYHLFRWALYVGGTIVALLIGVCVLALVW